MTPGSSTGPASPGDGPADPAILEERLAALERAETAAQERMSDLQRQAADLEAMLRQTRAQLSLARLKLEQTELALSKLSTLYSSAVVPIVVADPMGTITDVNPAAEQRYGRRRADLLGASLAELVLPRRRGQLDGMLAACRSGRTLRNVDRDLFGPEHATAATSTTLMPLKDSSGRVLGIALAEDVRELKESRALLQEVNARLQGLVLADPLTGLPNRRHFERELDREVGRAARYRETIALLMADVDHFKGYNDTYGHPAGDECLKGVGAQIAQCLRRPSDFVARWGGEEFTVLLPRTPRDGARAMAETIRLAVERLHGLAGSGLHRPVTVSIGAVAARILPGTTPQQVVDAADRALYRAKQGGRNQVVFGELTDGPGRDRPPPPRQAQ